MTSESFPKAMSFRPFSELFICKVCNKQFANSSALDSHSFEHTAVEPFCCDHCGRQFVNERNCQVHVISHILDNIGELSISNDPETEVASDIDKTLFDNKRNVVVMFVEDREHVRNQWKKFDGSADKVINASDKTLNDGISPTETSDFNTTIRTEECNQAKEMSSELSTEVVIFNKKRILVKGPKHENVVPNRTNLLLTVLPTQYKHDRDKDIKFIGIEHAYATCVEDSNRADQIRNSSLQPGKEVTLPQASGAAHTDKDSSYISKSGRAVRSEESVKLDDENVVNDQEVNTPDSTRNIFDSSSTYADCQICGKRFVSIRILKLHMHIHGNKFKCEFCDEIFTNFINHKRHVKASHPAETEGHEKNYKCGVCGMYFMQTASLKSHMNIHTGEGPQCGVCGKQFLRSSGLKNHMTIHTGERPHKCSVCNKTFKESGQLMYHKRIHTGERPYKCEKCDKDFVKSCHLKRHIRTHSKSSVSCRFCRRRFTKRGSHFNAHESTCRTALYKKFECGICGMTFAVESSLRNHMRIHGEKRFACSICGKGFIWKHCLRDHMTTHMVEKQHKCSRCDKEYRTKAMLRRHVSDCHDEEGEFVCDVCNKQFTRLSAITHHMCVHTGDNKDTYTHW